MLRRTGFTLIELLVVISIIALLIGILLPALGMARKTARQMQSSTQVRGIHNALVTFAQGNKSYYPGLNSDGALEAGGLYAPPHNYERLLLAGFFPGEYAISPVDVKATWTSGTVSTQNFSYSMLSIQQTAEQAEWQDTINTDAIVLSDRGIGTSHVTALSVWTGDPSEGWRGSVGWNDNHVSFEPARDSPTTAYGSDPVNDNDHLFGDNHPDLGDAFMVYGGPGPAIGDVLAAD